jgi:cytochrome c551/c552
MALAGCGSEDTLVEITERDGQALFERRAMGNQAGCVTCHSLAPDVILVGPSLADVNRSAAAAGAADVRAYLRQSIEEPLTYTVPGFETARPMPVVFGELLDAEQIDAIVDYLLETAP